MMHYKIKNYHGCFVKNQLPSRLSHGFYIINLNGQSHWTALYKHGKNYYYYDSYGFVPPLEVENKLPEYIYKVTPLLSNLRSRLGKRGKPLPLHK